MAIETIMTHKNCNLAFVIQINKNLLFVVIEVLSLADLNQNNYNALQVASGQKEGQLAITKTVVMFTLF